ncbi:MAG: FeoA family protein [Cytophagales bacterium]|nr:FeoA family protein [Cytophagales bacterium]
MKVGQKSVITGFESEDAIIKFLEMGCLPGTEIEMYNVAPMGSPICIKIHDYYLGLRKSEAGQIKVKML